MSKLKGIQKKTIKAATRWLIYGAEGVGKSTLASDSDNAIFVDIEGGTNNLSVARYPMPPRNAIAYDDVKAALIDLRDSAHEYRTIVIDSIDALEPLLQRTVCKAANKASIEDFGYGKGYVAAVDEWRIFINVLDALVAKGLDVILLGHSIVKNFKNPLGEDFDRYQLRIHEKAAAQIKEWCDVVGFVRFDEGAAKLQGDKSQGARARGYDTKKREINFEYSAAWDAKSRLPLPAVIEMQILHPWQPIRDAIAGSDDLSFVRTQIAAELQRLGDSIESSKGPILASDIAAQAAATNDRQVLTSMLHYLQRQQKTETQGDKS